MKTYEITDDLGNIAEAVGIENARCAARTLVEDGATRAEIRGPGDRFAIESAAQGKFGGVEISTSDANRGLR
jgi:hypothetical protein